MTLRALSFAVLLFTGAIGASGEGEGADQREKADTVTASTEQPQVLKVLDVCDALQRSDALNGAQVSIRGYYRFGMEMSGLYGRNCPKALIIDGKERLQAFHLKYEQKVDDAELAAAVRKMKAETDVRSAILVTVSGKLDAISHVWTDGHGLFSVERKARQFGHLGAFPAEIRIQSFRELVVVDAPDFISNRDNARR